MTANLSRLLNALGLVAIDTVLVLAFADQLWFRDLPCPLCILQRVGFIAAGFCIALNLMFGPRPSHYGLAILGAVAGGFVSARQILLNIAHNSAYGSAVFGLHLYTWALLLFALIVVGSAIMLQFEHQFAATDVLPSRLKVLTVLAVALLATLALGKVISTLAICGAGLCPYNPAGYMIFNDNLSLTLLGKTP